MTRTRRRSSSDMPIVVYIHGIGIHPGKEELKHQWDLATFGKDMGERTRMAHWADILHSDDTGKPQGKRAVRARSKAVPLEAAALLEEIGLDPEDTQALGFVEALAASLARGETVPPSGRGTRKKVLPLPGFLRRPVAERLLRWLVKDTAAYFFDRRIRQAIKKRLLAEIPKNKRQPFILVSHSHGTIVAYEVLSELGDRVDVPLLVTIGSPLGFQEIQDLLVDDSIPLEVPRSVRSWQNFADRLDPVSLDPSLDTEFAPRGSVRIRDRLIVNSRTKDLQRFNPHSSVGYLSHPAVRSVVHDALGFDSAGRFVVARDVAERFVGIDRRQPVLIEVLEPKYWAVDESMKAMQDREDRQIKKDASLAELSGRIADLAGKIRSEVQKRARDQGLSSTAARDKVKASRIQKLRKYVAAHLTPEEIEWLARNHKDLNVYAVWRSTEKHKLLHRSLSPIKVDAAQASYGADGEGIVWAVLDTGARWDHPHFTTHNTIIKVLDCTTESDIPEPIEESSDGDLDGHGTHVAGIIAGEAEDEDGYLIQGIAPLARLYIYKVLDDEGSGEDAWTIKAIDDIYRRNEAAVGIKIHGVNLSLGGSFDPTVYGCGYSPTCKELRDLWRQGVLVCVAAGNEGQIHVLTDDEGFDLNTQISIGDPANLDDCIAVGSVNADKPHLYGVSHFSSRGPTADGRVKPDVVAPGERILSCNSHFPKPKKGKYADLYREDSGTSMACPHVSGLLAAFLSVRQEFRGRPDEVKQILLENCNDLCRDRYHQGAGLPNLMKMLLNT